MPLNDGCVYFHMHEHKYAYLFFEICIRMYLLNKSWLIQKF